MEPAPDLMLDPNVLLVLDHFKPALHDVFHTFCNRQLSSPSEASSGMGSIRMSERTFWKHTQDSANLSGCSFGRSTMYGAGATEYSATGDRSSPKSVKLEQEPATSNGLMSDADGVALTVVPT